MVATVAHRRLENQEAGTMKVRDYARHVWLAGLGAFAKAEREGNRMFEMLVKRGEEVEGRARKRAEDKVEEVKEEVRDRVEEVRGRANETWDKMEQVFQDRVARALNRLGVPNRYDIDELFKRLDELQEGVEKLIKAEEAEALSNKAQAA